MEKRGMRRISDESYERARRIKRVAGRKRFAGKAEEDGAEWM